MPENIRQFLRKVFIRTSREGWEQQIRFLTTMVFFLVMTGPYMLADHLLDNEILESIARLLISIAAITCGHFAWVYLIWLKYYYVHDDDED